MFKALNELNSDIVVVDKSLKTTSTANYPKRAHSCRIKKCPHAKKVLLLYITHQVARPCSHLHAGKKSDSAVTITANKMYANTKTIIFMSIRNWE